MKENTIINPNAFEEDKSFLKYIFLYMTDSGEVKIVPASNAPETIDASAVSAVSAVSAASAVSAVSAASAVSAVSAASDASDASDASAVSAVSDASDASAVSAASDASAASAANAANAAKHFNTICDRNDSELYDKNSLHKYLIGGDMDNDCLVCYDPKGIMPIVTCNLCSKFIHYKCYKKFTKKNSYYTMKCIQCNTRSLQFSKQCWQCWCCF
jgi:hypothetical protein